MKLSIAMATYNGAKYLRAQLDSFAAQSRLPDEVVICDDGSRDATVDILRDFAGSAPFEVRVIQNETNLGFVRNFEKALSLCTGDIILLSDQDDVWLPEKLATVERTFLADPRAMSTINDMIITDQDLRHQNVTLLGNIRRTGFGENRFIAGCCTAIRRDMLQALLPFPADHFAHDSWIGDMCVAFGVRRLIDSPMQLYRRHGSNESQWLLSEPREVSKFEAVVSAGLASPLKGWQPYMQRLEIMRCRILDNRASFERIGLFDEVEPALSWIAAEAGRYGGRIHLLSLPRYRRWMSVIGFWMRGGYRRFSGWKSAVKDMIRP
ncbi:glycosyltransferase family 2 protein [Paragemmobacter ruber]|uniref:Glycosyltransferase n=1 Tax=Paragemmobacter ruber TaxID=1985673 RepID=A0ABW9Y2N6_9RHOB|nr:glycosyltransferase family 2 protein [Rhodobacter ruber]NBE06494.1 glycosyltransferase [Rhodobacter ruber]